MMRAWSLLLALAIAAPFSTMSGFDGRDVTAGLRQSGPTTFTVDLPWPLTPGSHRVRFYGTREGGESFNLFWSFVRG